MLNDSNIEKTLINNLGSKSNYSKFKRVEITAKQQLEILINKWVAKKIFDGKGSKNDFSSLRFSLAQHKSYFLEFIEEIVSEKYGLYSFSIEHEDFGCETEALCFYGNNKCLYIYFGWWD